MYRFLQDHKGHAPTTAAPKIDADINYSFSRALTEKQLAIDEAGSTPGERFFQKTELARVNRHMNELFVVNRFKTRVGVWERVIRFVQTFRP
jgi:hypothetical protein